MNEDPENELLRDWIRHQREQPVPAASTDFVEQTMSRIGQKTLTPFVRFRNGLLKVAAVFIAGAVGFLRIELVLHFLLHSL